MDMIFTDTYYGNPFPGLRAFEEHEDVLFFGREKQVDELLRKLRTVRFLAVIGSSGSGKSSLVKSGLIPSLHSGFMAGTSSLWQICSFRPGNDPIGNLARALTKDGVLNSLYSQDEEDIYTSINESILRRSTFGLTEIYKQSGIDPRTNLLILVDQFEELFRFSQYEKEAKDGKRDSVAFINLLLKAVEQKELHIYVVFTMRSDFLGDCTEFRGLPEMINEGQYLIPRMTREERREAIAGPISVGGAEISQRLLSLLLNDVGDNPDQLPILQHALMRTWDIWEKKNPAHERPLDIEDYEEAGTMQYALSQHAEEAYSELSTTKQKQVCEYMFKALTDRGAGIRGIRRPRTVAEIAEVSNSSIEEVIEIIEVFRKRGRAFLMPPEEVNLTGSSIIDISHESLMRVWIRLINWVEEEGQSAQMYLRLCEAADQYELGKGGLWRSPELQIALKWKETQAPNATWASRYNNMFEKAMLFLQHSKQQYEQELKHKELQQRRRLQRAKRVVLYISCIALVALFLAVYSFQQKNIATKQTKLAIAKTKEAITQQKIAQEQKILAEKNKEQALSQKRLAEESEEDALDQKRIAEAERLKAIQSEQNALLQKSIAERQRSYAEKQKLVADSNEELAKYQQNIAEQQTERAVRNEKMAVEEQKVSSRLKDLAESRNLAYQALLLLNENKDKESIETAKKAYDLNEENEGPEQNNDVYNALHFNWVKSIRNSNQSLFHKHAVKAVISKPGSNIVFSADESGTIGMFKVDDSKLQPLFTVDTKNDIRSLVLSADGSILFALSAQGNAFVYSITPKNTLKEQTRFTFNGIAKSARFYNNSIYILSSESISKWTDKGAGYKADNIIPQKDINAMIVSPSGKIIMASGNKVSIYNHWPEFDKPASVFTLNGTVTSLALDAGEQYLAAGTYKGTVWLKDLKSAALPYNTALHISSVNDLEFGRTTENRIQLASAGADQTIKLIDVKDAVSSTRREDVITLHGHTKWIYTLCYISDGSLLLSASEDYRIIGWKPAISDLYKSLSLSP